MRLASLDLSEREFKQVWNGTVHEYRLISTCNIHVQTHSHTHTLCWGLEWNNTGWAGLFFFPHDSTCSHLRSINSICFPTKRTTNVVFYKKGTWGDKNVGQKKKILFFNLDKTHRAQTYLQAPKTKVKNAPIHSPLQKAQGITFSLFFLI